VRTAYVLTTAVVVVLVLVQAVIAGQFLFDGADIKVHGYIGNASFVFGLAAAALAVLSRLQRWLIALNVLLVVALFSQTGLGYVGRESSTAASWHVPLGVTTFGLAVAALTGALVALYGGRLAADPPA
jgi:hypothetical protein